MSGEARVPARARAHARLADTARMLPLLCFFLLIAPVFLLPDNAPRASVAWLAWLFGAWGGLLLLTYVVARWAHRMAKAQQ